MFHAFGTPTVLCMSQHSPNPATAARYGAVAQVFHWLTAVGVIAGFTIGLIMVEMAFSPLQLKLFSWHKWIGVSIFALLLLRLGWRLGHPAPPLPASTPPWQRHAAYLTHWALYALLLLIPLSGWVMSSAKGFSTVVFGVLPLPDLLEKNEALGDRLADLHWWLNKTLLALFILHLAAALKHQFVDRDGLMWRMLPGRRAQGDS